MAARGGRRSLRRLRDRLVKRLFGVGRTDIVELADRTESLSQTTLELQGSLESIDRDQKTIAADLRKLGGEMGLVRGRTDELLAEAEHLGIDLRNLRVALEELTGRTHGLENRTAHVEERIAGLEKSQERVELHARISPTMTWIEHAEVPEDTLVSVVLATRDRPRLLDRAIRSVVAQTYEHWELLIVDDGDDHAPVVVEPFAEPRIRVLRTGGRGVAAARNVGLGESQGNLIAYLDDDNLMHPAWLKSVVWAFSQLPSTEVVYGARIVEDPHVAGLTRWGLFAPVQLEPFDRRRLEEENFIDVGVVAHRRELPEARFDESLATQSDWDVILRLTRDRPPVALPAVALLYGTGAPERLTSRPGKLADGERIRERARGSRPVRVLGYNAIFPLLSESYVGEELEAIAGEGAAVAYCRRDPPTVDMPVGRPVYEDLDVAIREFEPDLLMIHWVTFAGSQLSRLEAAGLPFAVRAHSFDLDPATAKRVQEHPLCVGVWAFPHHAPHIPGAAALPGFLTAQQIPNPALSRDLVMSVSAGLPKKDWDLSIRALCALGGVERRIILATTNNYEDLPATIVGKLEGCTDPPILEVNVPREEVFGLLARTAVLVYTLDPAEPFGMPMSVIEGLCLGAAAVVPDRTEARELAGPHARTYRTADDIVRHVREVMAGGPDIEAEHRHNRDYGLERFTDPAIGKRFAAELWEALDRWRADRGRS